MGRELAKSRDLIGDDLPYAGMLGRTRSEVVQVLMPDGAVRSLSIYVGIDAVADPALAALARAGTLHHLGDEVELAVAFSYHDPLSRVFVLVIPEGLRYRALALRAELMLAIAADARHGVPDYVRDVETVVGSRGLALRLAAPVAELSSDDDATAARARALAARELELTHREQLLEAREQALRSARPGPALHAVHDSEIEEIDAGDAAELYERAVTAENALVRGGGVDDLDSGVEEIDESVEEVEDVDAGDVAIEAEDLEAMNVARPIAEFDASLLSPPDAFTIDPALPLWLTERGGQVWLFVRGRPSPRHGDGEVELLVQLDPSVEPPVVLLSLVFDVGGAPEVRRGVIDPFVSEQMRALYLLAQHFEVELVAASGQGLTHFATLHMPRERNVRSILAHLERYGEIDREAWLSAREAQLAAPPPWRDRSHPFQRALSPELPLTATEAAVQLDAVSEWLAPDRQARLRMALSVPDEVIDAVYRATIASALDWGLSLSRELLARALELGIEKDEGSLLERRIEGLCRTSRETSFGGMEQGVLRAEWSEALEQAARLGVTLTVAARELALKHAGDRALVHATALADTHDEALDPVRARANAEPPDESALEELVQRGGYRDVLSACRLAHKLTPEAAGRLFAHLARRVDPIALDALLSLLSSPSPLQVRAGAGLALAARRALNALDDLAGHLAREGEPEYALFALALGRYGAGSFRAIARALKRHGVSPKRAALVYAHLALHGARAQVRAKARSHDPHEADLAAHALSLAGELKDGKKPALGLEQQGSLTVFCEMFDRVCRDTVG